MYTLIIGLFCICFSVHAVDFVEGKGEFTFVDYNGVEVIPFQKLYIGKIVENGNYYFYVTKNRNIKIGKYNEFPCSNEFKNICKIVLGKKNSNNYSNTEIIRTVSIEFYKKNNSKSSFRGLESFALASPNQEDAGSCIYMAMTGAVEILLNQYYEIPLPGYDGDFDISERHLMSFRLRDTYDAFVPYWTTDAVLIFNFEGGVLRNRDYRYTKGWYKRNADGVEQRALQDNLGALYGTPYNWIDEYNIDLKRKLIQIPKIKRNVIFLNQDQDLWTVGVMNDDLIGKIKQELRDKQSPVIVIYNHFNYWHATVIVGYDDEKQTEECPFVKAWKKKNEEDPDLSPYRRENLKKLNLAMQRGGGCTSKGVFYVRDSIYNGLLEPLYDYDLSRLGEEKKYSLKIIERSYEGAAIL